MFSIATCSFSLIKKGDCTGHAYSTTSLTSDFMIKLWEDFSVSAAYWISFSRPSIFNPCSLTHPSELTRKISLHNDTVPCWSWQILTLHFVVMVLLLTFILLVGDSHDLAFLGVRFNFPTPCPVLRSEFRSDCSTDVSSISLVRNKCCVIYEQINWRCNNVQLFIYVSKKQDGPRVRPWGTLDFSDDQLE